MPPCAFRHLGIFRFFFTSKKSGRGTLDEVVCISCNKEIISVISIRCLIYTLDCALGD